MDTVHLKKFATGSEINKIKNLTCLFTYCLKEIPLAARHKKFRWMRVLHSGSVFCPSYLLTGEEEGGKEEHLRLGNFSWHLLQPSLIMKAHALS